MLGWFIGLRVLEGAQALLWRLHCEPSLLYRVQCTYAYKHMCSNSIPSNNVTHSWALTKARPSPSQAWASSQGLALNYVSLSPQLDSEIRYILCCKFFFHILKLWRFARERPREKWRKKWINAWSWKPWLLDLAWTGSSLQMRACELLGEGLWSMDLGPGLLWVLSWSRWHVTTDLSYHPSLWSHWAADSACA